MPGSFMTTSSENGLIEGIYSIRGAVTWALHDYGLRKRTSRPSVRSIYSIRGAVIWAFHDYGLRKRTIRPSELSIYFIREQYFRALMTTASESGPLGPQCGAFIP